MTQHFPCDPRSSEDAGGWIVRRGRVEDLDKVLAIAECAPTAANWAREAYRTFCAAPREEDHLLAKTLFVASDSQRREIAGFAAFQAIRASGECGLENMAVEANWRRRGIGFQLLAAGMLWCRSHAASGIWLEVRISNLAAVAFYRQAGFIQAGRRREYYSHPGEDALVMSRELCRGLQAGP